MIEFKKLIDAKALYQELDKIWVAKGMTFFAIDYNGKREVSHRGLEGSSDELASTTFAAVACGDSPLVAAEEW